MGELYSLGFSVLTTIVGLAIVWGRTMGKIDGLQKDICRLRRGIWKEDGTSIYVTADEHYRAHNDLKHRMEEMRRDLLTQFAEFKQELRQQAERNREEFSKIAVFMGRMEEFLRNSEWEDKYAD